MSGHHVGEQSHRQADRPREIGNHLDRDQQWRHPHRRAVGEEIREEMSAMSHQADDSDPDEHHKGEAEGDDDLAREGMDYTDLVQSLVFNRLSFLKQKRPMSVAHCLNEQFDALSVG